MWTTAIENKLIGFFNEAVARPENQDYESQELVDWNFVEADVFMDARAAGIDIEAMELACFIDGLIEEYLEFGVVEMAA